MCLEKIDGDVVFFDGTVFENLDEGVLCRYVQVNRCCQSKHLCSQLFVPARLSLKTNLFCLCSSDFRRAAMRNARTKMSNLS